MQQERLVFKGRKPSEEAVMNKRIWIGVGVLVWVWSVPSAQAQRASSAKRAVVSVDGARATVLQAGSYRVMALVGEPVSGGVANGGLWQLRQQLKAKEAVEGLRAAGEVPTEYALEGNYPNPFNPETVIRFGMPESGAVRLSVYDVLGRRVAVLVDGPLAAGRHEVTFGGGNLSSGLYVYRLEAGSFEAQRTMLLVK